MGFSLSNQIQDFAGAGDHRIRAPCVRIAALAVIAPAGGEKVHARGAGRLRVAQVVADVYACRSWQREERSSMEQRSRMRLDVRGRVAAHYAGGEIVHREEVQERRGEALALVGDDAPGELARPDLHDQLGDPVEKARLDAQLLFVEIQK